MICLGLLCVGMLLGGELQAAEVLEVENVPVSQAWMREALNKIEARLAAIEENQNRILDGQKLLSEEHRQLRYWVHRN